ncbi:hypothetical protein [Pandoravirus japonicus]|uniref:Uncharacterized protein n=1 Tax=Pandoravirus japonicus TaxID=2823154 RepID=A0A811BPB5_9VIRU|nr:hypothetical protein [Pandoravirus japonicus]
MKGKWSLCAIFVLKTQEKTRHFRVGADSVLQSRWSRLSPALQKTSRLCLAVFPCTIFAQLWRAACGPCAQYHTRHPPRK